jgi:hypothetical protein
MKTIKRKENLMIHDSKADALSTPPKGPLMLSEPEMAANYDAFVAGLTDLSRQYGIAIKAIGGVRISDRCGGFADLVYEADASSGDLWCPDLD